MEKYLKLLKIYKKIKKYSTKIIEFKMKIWKNNKIIYRASHENVIGNNNILA